MRKFGTLLWVGVIIALTVNARGELGQAMSSREVVKQQLERMGVKVGYDAAGGRMVAVETWGYSLKDDEANNDFGMTETYDFSDDASDDVEGYSWDSVAQKLVGVYNKTKETRAAR